MELVSLKDMAMFVGHALHVLRGCVHLGDLLVSDSGWEPLGVLRLLPDAGGSSEAGHIYFYLFLSSAIIFITNADVVKQIAPRRINIVPVFSTIAIVFIFVSIVTLVIVDIPGLSIQKLMLVLSDVPLFRGCSVALS